MTHSDLLEAAWSVDAVRAAEDRALSAYPPPDLMARASTGLLHHCLRLLARDRSVYGARVVVLIGRGNNGGDALFAGALLAARGCSVTAVVAADEVDRAHRRGLAALRAERGRAISAVSSSAGELIAGADLILDGLVGIGARGALREPAAGLAGAAIEARKRGARVVAVDLPSGIDADTGEVPDPKRTVSADLTVSFGCLKPGLLLQPGASFSGERAVVDIGLLPLLRDPTMRIVSPAAIRSAWPKPEFDSDKYSRGVVGVATGSHAYPGAALLTVAGALAGPAGMVRYAGSAAEQVVAAHPETVVTTRVADAGRVQSWVVGSGLDTSEAARKTLIAALDRALPTVIDADGLTVLAELISRHGLDSLRLRPLFADAPIAVLTPHARELARLLDACGDELPSTAADSPLATARGLSDLLGVTLLVKGAHTLIVTPGRTAYVNVVSTPALATAGSGDVLSGLLGSLLAAGIEPHEAAATAAYLHGTAGVRAATVSSVTASTLAATLPATVAETCRNPRRSEGARWQP